MTIPLSSPDLTDEDRMAVMEVLNGTALSLGPKGPEFEEMVARATGSKYAVAVNSGTSALHLCVKAAGIHDGDEIVTTPFSFVASANCVLFERAVPVFADIDPDTYNLDPSLIERAITPRTRAILAVHVFGRPCAIDAIVRIAAEHGLEVIEDACEALGATYRGGAAGSFGRSGAFAFYPNKQITTGEGGMIVTSDERVAKSCRSWRNQGRAEQSQWLQHERLGYNYRLSDINCALGISQLRRLPEILARRRKVAELYDEALGQIPQIVRPSVPEPGADISWFVYVVRLTDEFGREHRDAVLAELARRSIGANNYFTPIHLQPFYRAAFGYREGDFPVTEHVSERTIALPFFNRLSASQVDYVCEALRAALARLRSRKAVCGWAQEKPVAAAHGNRQA